MDFIVINYYLLKINQLILFYREYLLLFFICYLYIFSLNI